MTAPQPAIAHRLRVLLEGDEWATLRGGSVLNKLGAVVLVIGIALFLAYSFAHVGEAGGSGADRRNLRRFIGFFRRELF